MILFSATCNSNSTTQCWCTVHSYHTQLLSKLLSWLEWVHTFHVCSFHSRECADTYVCLRIQVIWDIMLSQRKSGSRCLERSQCLQSRNGRTAWQREVKALRSSATPETTHLRTRYHTPEDLNLSLKCWSPCTRLHKITILEMHMHYSLKVQWQLTSLMKVMVKYLYVK